MKQQTPSSSDEVNIEEEIAYWLEIDRSSTVEAVKYYEETARQVITIAGFLEGAYFAAVSISDIKQVGKITDPPFALFVLLSALITIAWLLSIYYAMRVFIPEPYDLNGSETSNKESDIVRAVGTRDAFRHAMTHKGKYLSLSTQFLYLSFFPLIVNIIIYLVYLPTSPSP